MRNDIIMSCLVFVGVILNKLGLAWIDPLVSVVMSFIILKVAWDVFEENAHELMDGLYENEMWIYDRVFDVCKACGAYNPHKVRIRKIGGKFDIDMDVEVDGNMTVRQAYEITKCIRKRLSDSKISMTWLFTSNRRGTMKMNLTGSVKIMVILLVVISRTVVLPITVQEIRDKSKEDPDFAWDMYLAYLSSSKNP